VRSWHAGNELTIWLRTGCQESWDQAEAAVPGNRAACPTQFRARLTRLADHGKLRNPDYMNSEGGGVFAVKATCGLRAYGWFCRVEGRRAFVISHVVLKRRQHADPADIALAVAAKEMLEFEQQQHNKSQ
jgi:hypothetical protein